MLSQILEREISGQLEILSQQAHPIFFRQRWHFSALSTWLCLIRIQSRAARASLMPGPVTILWHGEKWLRIDGLGAWCQTHPAAPTHLRSIWIPFLPAQLADCEDCNRANWGTGQSLLFCAIQELISLLQNEIWFHEGF